MTLTFVSIVLVLIKNLKQTFLILLGVSISCSSALACPAFLSAKQLPLVEGTKRQQIRLFVLDNERNVRVWRDIAVQVDPLNEEGTLREGDHSLAMQANLEPTDRITMRVEDFRPARTPSDVFPCGSKQLIEIKDPNRKNAFAYLATCPEGVPQKERQVTYDAKGSVVTSKDYRYEFMPQNQLMFRRVDLLESGKFVNAVNASNLFLRFDLKSFLTLHLDNRNVKSLLNATHVGPLAAIASYSFFLKILFFNIDLRMDTSVSFFEDSAMIPLQFKAPMADVLNRGSGSFYWWSKGSDLMLDAEANAKTLPNASPDLILNDPAALAKKGLAFCKDKCIFRFAGKVGKKSFTIDMNVPRYLVEVGFFPQFVSDIGAFEKATNWPESSINETPGTVGIYFDSTLLPTGVHRVEQWLRISKDSNGTCPREIKHQIIKT